MNGWEGKTRCVQTASRNSHCDIPEGVASRPGAFDWPPVELPAGCGRNVGVPNKVGEGAGRGGGKGKTAISKATGSTRGSLWPSLILGTTPQCLRPRVRSFVRECVRGTKYATHRASRIKRTQTGQSGWLVHTEEGRLLRSMGYGLYCRQQGESKKPPVELSAIRQPFAHHRLIRTGQSSKALRPTRQVFENAQMPALSRESEDTLW